MNPLKNYTWLSIVIMLVIDESADVIPLLTCVIAGLIVALIEAHVKKDSRKGFMLGLGAFFLLLIPTPIPTIVAAILRIQAVWEFLGRHKTAVIIISALLSILAFAWIATIYIALHQIIDTLRHLPLR